MFGLPDATLVVVGCPGVLGEGTRVIRTRVIESRAWVLGVPDAAEGIAKPAETADDSEDGDTAEKASDDMADHVGDLAGLVIVPMGRAVAVLMDVDVKRSPHLSLKIWELF